MTEGGWLLEPFRGSSRAWLVVVRNLVPVVGVFGWGWSASLVLLEIWFDNVTALAATVGFAAYGFARNDPSWRGWAPLSWAGVTALFGAPYWFLLGLRIESLEDGFWEELFASGALVWVAVPILASNVIEAYFAGLHRMSDPKIRRQFRWESHVHLARASLLLMLGAFFGQSRWFVIPVAVTLTLVELYPARTLRLIGADEVADERNPD